MTIADQIRTSLPPGAHVDDISFDGDVVTVHVSVRLPVVLDQLTMTLEVDDTVVRTADEE